MCGLNEDLRGEGAQDSNSKYQSVCFSVFPILIPLGATGRFTPQSTSKQKPQAPEPWTGEGLAVGLWSHFFLIPLHLPWLQVSGSFQAGTKYCGG